MGQGALRRRQRGHGCLSAAELGIAGDQFIQVVDTGPAAGPFVGAVWTSPDGLTWRDAWTASGPLFAVASGPVGNVFGKGTQVFVSGWQRLDRDRPAEILLTSGAVTLSDGRSLVLDNTNVDPPSVVVQLVPAAVDPGLSRGLARALTVGVGMSASARSCWSIEIRPGPGDVGWGRPVPMSPGR